MAFRLKGVRRVFALAVVLFSANPSAASDLTLPLFPDSASPVCETFQEIDLKAMTVSEAIEYDEALHAQVYNRSAILLESVWEKSKASDAPLQGALASQDVLIASATWLIASAVPEGTDLDGVRARRQANVLQRLSLAWLNSIETNNAESEHWLIPAVRTELALVSPKYRNRIPPEVGLALRIWLDAPESSRGLLWPLSERDWSGEDKSQELLRTTFRVPKGYLAWLFSKDPTRAEQIEGVKTYLRERCQTVDGENGSRSTTAELQTVDNAISIKRDVPVSPVAAEIDWLLDELEKLEDPSAALKEHEAYRLCRVAEWIERTLTRDPARELRELADLEPSRQREWVHNQREFWKGILRRDANEEEGVATLEAVQTVFPPCLPPDRVSITPTRKEQSGSVHQSVHRQTDSQTQESEALLPSDDPPLLQLELTARDLGQLAPFMALAYADKRPANLKDAAILAWEMRSRLQSVLALTRNFRGALDNHLNDSGREAITRLEGVSYVLECPGSSGEEGACPNWLDGYGDKVESAIPASVGELKEQLGAREGWPRLSEIRDAWDIAEEVTKVLSGNLTAKFQDSAREMVSGAATDFAVDRALAAGAEYVPLDPDTYHVLWIRDQICLLLRRAHESGPGDETGPFSLDLMVGLNVSEGQATDPSRHTVWQCGKEALVMPLGVRYRNARFDPEAEVYELDVRGRRGDLEPAREVAVARTRALALELGVPRWMVQQSTVRVEVLGGAVLNTDTRIQLVVPISIPGLLTGSNQPEIVDVAIVLPDWTEGLRAGADELRRKVGAHAIARVAERIPGELSLGNLITISALERAPNAETERRPLVMAGTASIELPGIIPIRAPANLVISRSGRQFRSHVELGELEETAKRHLARLLVRESADLLEVIRSLRAEIEDSGESLAQMKADAERLRERIQEDLSGWGIRFDSQGECRIQTPSPMLALCIEASVPFPTWFTGGRSATPEPIWIDATIDERGNVSAEVRDDLEKRLKEAARRRLERERDRLVGQACQEIREEMCSTLANLDINMERDSAELPSSCESLGNGAVRFRAGNAPVGENDERAAILNVEMACGGRQGATFDFQRSKVGLVKPDGSQRPVYGRERVAAVRTILGFPNTTEESFLLGLQDIHFHREGVIFDLYASVKDQEVADVLGVDRIDIGTVTLNRNGLESDVSIRDIIMSVANDRILQLLEPAVERRFSFSGVRLANLEGEVLGSGQLRVEAHVDFDGLELRFPIQLKPKFDIDSSTAKQALRSFALSAFTDLLGGLLGNNAPTIEFDSGPPAHFKGKISGEVPGFDAFELTLGYRWSQEGLELDFPVAIPYPECIHLEPFAFDETTIRVNDPSFDSVSLTTRGTLAECEASAAFYILGDVTARLDRPAITTSNTAYVVGIPIFVNEGSISRQGMVAESRTVGPMRAIVELDSTTRLDNDGFSFSGDLNIFDLEIADASGTVSTQGLVEASGVVDWLVQDAEASFRSEPFPKNMRAGLNVTAFKVGGFDVGGVSASVGPRRARAAFTVLDIDFVLVEGTWREVTRDAILKTILSVLELDPEEMLEMLENIDDADIPREVQIKAPEGWETSTSSARSDSEGSEGSGGPGNSNDGKYVEQEREADSADSNSPSPRGTRTPAVPGQPSGKLRMPAYSNGDCKVSDIPFSVHCFARIAHNGQKTCSVDVLANRVESIVSDKRPVLTVAATHQAWDLISPPPEEAVGENFTLAAHPGQTHSYNLARNSRSDLLIVAPKESEVLQWVAISPPVTCDKPPADKWSPRHGNLHIELSDILSGVTVDALGSGQGIQPPQAGLDLLATLAVLHAAKADDISTHVVGLDGTTNGERAYLITYGTGGENMAWLAFQDATMPMLPADHPIVNAVKRVRSGEDVPPWLNELAASSEAFVAGAVADDGRALLRMKSRVLACAAGATSCEEWPIVFEEGAGLPTASPVADLDEATFESHLLNMLVDKAALDEDKSTLAWMGGANPSVVLVPADQEAPIAFVAQRQQRFSSCTDVGQEEFRRYFDDNPGCPGVSTRTAENIVRIGAQPRDARPTCPALSDVLAHLGQKDTCLISGEPAP